MSWRLAFHSAKLLFSYVIPYKMKKFRDAIFDKEFDIIQHYAAERPRLLQQSIDADGNTALGLAIQLGEVDVVKTLLALGSDPNIANAFDGNHSLVILAKLRSDENSKTATIAQLLLDAGANPVYEVRCQADGANRLDATQTPSFRETPLLCCVRFQNEELLKKFIEHGTDMNSLDSETGTSPLMLAAALGYVRICDLLIDAGADVNASDSSGNTPLHLAVQGYGKPTSVLKTLLDRGGDPNATNDDGFTPAMLAKRSDNDACFKILDMKTANVIQPRNLEKHEDDKDQTVFSFT